MILFGKVALSYFVPPRVSMATKGFLYLKSRNITFNAAMSFESFWLPFLMYLCNCVFACNWKAAASAALQDETFQTSSTPRWKKKKKPQCNHANKSSDDSLHFGVNCSITVSSIRFSGGKKKVISIISGNFHYCRGEGCEENPEW